MHWSRDPIATLQDDNYILKMPTKKPVKSFKLKKNIKSFSVYPKHVNTFEPYHSEEIESWKIFKIMAEFVSGFEFLRKYKKTASFFGSARCGFRDHVYQETTKLAYKLAKEKFAIITGGGPGVMEAANKGAADANGKSVGINIKLDGNAPTEERNQYVKESMPFDFFFVRKVMLSFSSRVYIFFPGGFGTLDELFEMITLVQTKKLKPIPIVLVGKEFWTPLLSWVEERLYKRNKAVSKGDLDLYHLVADADEAFKLIKKLVK